jgi:predicted DNA-binding mobile mystery protein A
VLFFVYGPRLVSFEKIPKGIPCWFGRQNASRSLREFVKVERKGAYTADPFSRVQIHRSITRRRLDKRLSLVAECAGTSPPNGWAQTIRRALGMSGSELSKRLGVSYARVGQLERGEVDGSIGLSTLRRVAQALNCELLYVFVPNEPLEDMVRRQARQKAAEEVAVALRVDGERPEDQARVATLLGELLDARALELVDMPGLWRERASRPAEPVPPGS